ncbi:MAG TPA: hypothetical protein VM183_13790 [Burkholderiales bacterium]|nr:hypothetical protein [Burkholderiales bacterium]
MNEVRRRLLELHKALVDVERDGYERTRGRMPDGDFLKALIDDPAFAWLAPLTALIVRLDEVEGEALPTEYVAEIKRLLKPDDLGLAFQRRYYEMLQKSPDALVAHGAVMQSLSRYARPKS